MAIRDLSVVPVLLVGMFLLVSYSSSEFKIVFQARSKTSVVQQQSLRYEVRTGLLHDGTDNENESASSKRIDCNRLRRRVRTACGVSL